MPVFQAFFILFFLVYFRFPAGGVLSANPVFLNFTFSRHLGFFMELFIPELRSKEHDYRVDFKPPNPHIGDQD